MEGLTKIGFDQIIERIVNRQRRQRASRTGLSSKG